MQAYKNEERVVEKVAEREFGGFCLIKRNIASYAQKKRGK
jgi:hypothetical protein